MHPAKLAYVVDGSTRWGSFERCAEIAQTVCKAFAPDARWEREDRERFSDDELFTALFFDARAARPTGSDPSQAEPWAVAVSEELGRRHGEEHLEQLARGPEGSRHQLSRASRGAAVGALLGAACGDAAGAVLEFLGRAPSRAEVERALAMPGGGCWRVAPGQVTDDTELTIALADAMVDAGGYDERRVAHCYVAWYESEPFDVGNATRSAFGCRPPERSSVADHVRAAARKSSSGSKANGSLMRASPLGVYGHGLSDDALVAIARADASLSHPSAACADAVAAYALAVAHLVRHPGDRRGAFERAQGWCEAAGDEEVRTWLRDAAAGRLPAFHPLAGFVRIAFTAAFAHLHAGRGYVDALRRTLEPGGDTDTNACIVGGLLGAADGEDAIPAAMRAAVIGADTAKGRPRPDWLHPRHLPGFAEALGWCGARRAENGRG